MQWGEANNCEHRSHKKGISRIVSHHKEGAGVVTTRGHTHYVVTEYGIAYLYGKNLRQRAKELIGIAHPDDREILQRNCLIDSGSLYREVVSL